jgi:sporulation protein YlmC with PRC-barrel domain
MTAAFSVILAAATPMAYGQSTTTTTAPPASSTMTTVPTMRSTVRSTATANHLLPGQIRTSAMNGATVYDVQNRKVGDVKDIILDRDGRVGAVVLDVGAFLGMGGKFVAVSMNDIKVSFGDNNKPKFAIDMTKDQLKSAQAFNLNEKNAGTGSSTPPTDRTR